VGVPRAAAQAEMDRRLTLICNARKTAGIAIYTIMLKVNDTDLQDLFRNCASNPAYFFEAPSSADLSEIIRAIANDPAQLRIAE
jgi:hypothetical protein